MRAMRRRQRVDPYQRLACGIIERAALDARGKFVTTEPPSTKHEARLWLRRDGPALAELAGLPHVAARLPKLADNT